MSSMLLVLAAMTASGCATARNIDWGRTALIVGVNTVAAAADVAAADITNQVIYGGRRYGYNPGWRYGLEQRANEYQRRIAGRVYGDCIRASGYDLNDSDSPEAYQILQGCYWQGKAAAGLLPRY